LTRIPSSPPTAKARSTEFGLDGSGSDVPGLTPSSSASTDISSTTSDTLEVDLYAGADPQSLEYAKEHAMTWEELRSRPPLFGGEEVGKYRFASVDEICRSKT